MKVLIEYPKKGKDTVKVSVKWMDLVDMYQTIARLLYPLFKKYRATYNKNKAIGKFPLSMTEGICEPYAMSDEQEAACLEKWLCDQIKPRLRTLRTSFITSLSIASPGSLRLIILN
jgi:hypothetical protein